MESEIEHSTQSVASHVAMGIDESANDMLFLLFCPIDLIQPETINQSIALNSHGILDHVTFHPRNDPRLNQCTGLIISKRKFLRHPMIDLDLTLMFGY